MSTYPISPRLAEQAAKDYLAIFRAGMVLDLLAEIRQSIEAHNGVAPDQFTPLYVHHSYHANRLDQWRDSGGRQIANARDCASDLAELLDCPLSAVESFIVPELISGETRRTIVLDCLRNVANVARRQVAGRRS